MGLFITLAIVAFSLLASLLIGLLASWNRQVISEDYFLASRALPWYAVALSVLGAGLGLEYLLGVIGLSYTMGLAPAGLSWGSFLAISLLVWVSLPFLYRKKLYSTAEFLERRYSRSARAVFSLLVLAALVLGVLVPSLYAGGWVLSQAAFGHTPDGLDWVLAIGVLVLAISTAAYSVYGGLAASVWASVFQMLLLIGGLTALAVAAVQQDSGGVLGVLQKNGPGRTNLFLADSCLPWTGMIAFWFTLAVWNTAANPMTVQRCLGARSEWDARMGVIGAGFLRLLLPALIVLPGLAAYVTLGPQSVTGATADQAFFWILDGVFSREGALGALGRGFVISAVLAALMSTMSSVLHAVSAVWTMDVCQDLLHQNASEAELVQRGRKSSLVTVILGAILAPFLVVWSGSVFDYVLEVAAIIGPPVAAVFLVGLFWSRAHGRAATATLVLGVAAGGLLWGVAEHGLVVPDWLNPVLNRAGLSGSCSLILLGLGTFIIPQNPDELYDPDTNWSLSAARLPPHEQDLGAGLRNLAGWWAVLLAAMLALWVVFR